MPFTKLVACKIGESDGRTVWEPDEPLENLSRFALAGVIAVYEGYCAK